MANQVGQELLNVPFPEMVLKLALAIADGQTKLDMNSTAIAKFMAETKFRSRRSVNQTRPLSFQFSPWASSLGTISSKNQL